MRVHELSEQLGKKNKEVIDFLKSEGYSVSSHLNQLDDDMIDKTIRYFSPTGELSPDGEKKSIVEEEHIPSRCIRDYRMDEFIPCRSVTPWKLVLSNIDRNMVYTWEFFGAVENVMFRDLQAWRKKDILTAPKIIIEDADLRYAWRQDLAESYKTLIGVEFPEELFSLNDVEFEKLLSNASITVKEIIKHTAISMIRNENYPSISKLIKIDEMLGTDLKDFLPTS